MWVLTDEEMISLQNRMNDLWETDTRPRAHGEYIAAANRLIGALNTLMTPQHYNPCGQQNS